MDNIPGWETAVYVAMIKCYFHHQRPQKKSLYISDKSGSRPVDSSSSKNLIWGYVFLDEGLRLFLPGTGGPGFHHCARKLDNLAAGRGSDGKFTALFSYPPLSLIPFTSSSWQNSSMKNWHFGCQKKEVKYIQRSQYSESFRDVVTGCVTKK